ncbi:FAD-dependent oxidoreductase [Nocardioides sp. NPDC057767]|uniref:FAD-dependent oxidoreductase n=1 Tax=unclassified Nocardioides TaxID=2615069 RepID=UPI003672D2F1
MTDTVHEADVVVVGLGCAGGAAALEARRAGASVTALERASGAGGSSAQSGGELYLGGGTAVQQALGLEDDADNMYAYLHAALGPHADEEKLRLYCDDSVEHFDWLASLGIDFERSLYDAPSWMPSTTDGLMWLGENAWPYDELARPVPRGHRPATESFGGWLVMDRLVAACAEAGVETHPDTRATELLVEDGRVVGVRARRFGEDLTYRARRGVVVATGGFADNEAMVAAHATDLLGHGTVSDGGDDGSGIVMAQAIGAAVRRMSVVEVAYTALPLLACQGMLINARGERFINEDVYPGLYSHAALHEPGPCWVIVDGRTVEETDEADLWGVVPSHAAETIEELEADLGMPVGSLARTVAAYNAGAAAGGDPLFHKNPRWTRVLSGPYAAIDPRIGFHNPTHRAAPGATGFAGFTLGGLHTTVDGEVLDLTGIAIPGLYAAGRASAGMHGHGYISGTSLGDGTFFGRRAGRAAARHDAR